MEKLFSYNIIKIGSGLIDNLRFDFQRSLGLNTRFYFPFCFIEKVIVLDDFKGGLLPKHHRSFPHLSKININNLVKNGK